MVLGLVGCNWFKQQKSKPALRSFSQATVQIPKKKCWRWPGYIWPNYSCIKALPMLLDNSRQNPVIPYPLQQSELSSPVRSSIQQWLWCQCSKIRREVNVSQLYHLALTSSLLLSCSRGKEIMLLSCNANNAKTYRSFKCKEKSVWDETKSRGKRRCWGNQPTNNNWWQHHLS